jgi:hypothetical protein
MQKQLTLIVMVLALLSPGLLWADAQAKPTDPQIAHIAYTAGLLDVEAGKTGFRKIAEQGCVCLRAANDRRPYRGQRPSSGPGEEAQRDARG